MQSTCCNLVERLSLCPLSSGCRPKVCCKIATAVLFAFLAFLAVPFILHGRPEFESARRIISWYAYWFYLGLKSVLGYGNASHTHLFNLAPFVARVTSSAYVCQSTDFNIIHISGTACPKEPYARVHVGLTSILMKIMLESVVWGIGSAVGELLPYFAAKSYFVSRQRAIEKGASKHTPRICTLISRCAAVCLEPLCILFWAAIPNSLFEATGLLCGFFGVPCHIFLPAFFLGKAIIRPIVLACFVILLFSKDYLEYVLSFFKLRMPRFANMLYHEITYKRQLYQQIPDPNSIGLWVRNIGRLATFALMAYFMVRSAVIFARLQSSKKKL